MRKIISFVLLLALFAGILSGCHGSVQRSEFVIPESFDTSRTYQITFWAKNENNETQQKIYAQAVADFEAIYPNIDVTLKLFSDYNTIYQDVITNLATNTTPNVCITYPDHIATYITGNDCVVPLDQLFADEKYGLGGSEILYDSVRQDEIVANFLEECKIGDQYYAMPYMRSTEACYINKTYVEALGYTVPDVLTWDFIWEVCEKAMEQNADGTFALNGQKVMIPMIYKSTDNMMIQMLKQYGADYSTAEGEVLLFNDSMLDILAMVQEQTEKGTFDTFKNVSYPGNYFNRGQCIFAVDSTAGATWIGENAPLVDIPDEERVSFETVVRPVPQVDPDNPAMISQGPSVCVFNKSDPQEVLASWIFAQFLLTNEVQIAYSQTEGYVPVTTKAQQSDVYLDYISRAGEDNNLYYQVKLDTVQMLLDNIDHTFVTPVFNGSASVRNAAGQLIEEITKAVHRKKTIDDAFMKKLQSDMTSLYRLDQLQTGSTQQREDLGPLPREAVLLLSALGLTWICIGFVALRNKRKEGKNQ